MTNAQYLKNLSVPKGKVDVIIDSDTFTEIDDPFAISYLLASTEKCRVIGLCVAPFVNDRAKTPADGMNFSFTEIEKILRLAHREDLLGSVYHGAPAFLENEETPVQSDASRYLVKTALTYTPEKPLYVVAIGAITNVASAILSCPAITENMVVVWLGGHAHTEKDTGEYNMAGDMAAARILFGCGVPLVQLPCRGVVSEFSFCREEFETMLSGKGELAEYLLENTVTQSTPCSGNQAVWSRIIWDVTAAGWLMNENNRFMELAIVPAPMPQYDNTYEFRMDSHPMCYVNKIHCKELKADLARKLGGKQ